MGWIVTLSNNESVKQNEADITSWRQLHEKCKNEGLKIKEIRFNGEDPHPNTPLESYFVIYDIFVPNVLTGGKDQQIKIGVGGFYKDEDKSGLCFKSHKCRIKWYRVQGNPFLYTEVIENGSMYRDYTIEKLC